jgi:hypothetical protein
MGSGTGREPEEMPCVCTAGIEGVARGERAAGIP